MRVVRRGILIAGVAVLVAGCGDDPPPAPGLGGGGEAGGAGGAGGGAPEPPRPGIQENGCRAGEIFEAGTCRPAGVPETGCAEGFASDGLGGCAPRLPDEPCPASEMAVPGETACRPVMACPEGRYGAGPHPPGTLFVDAAYGGGESDGSVEKPFSTIQAAIDAAGSGATIAIAAGTYAESLDVPEPATLSGRCPSMVELAPPGGAGGSIAITIEGGSGHVVRGIAIKGGAAGILAENASDVRIEETWIHDTRAYGVAVQEGSSVTLRGVLVENSQSLGLFVSGSDVEVEASVLRGVVHSAGDPNRIARGVSVQRAEGAATLIVRRSVVELAGEMGVFVAGASASLDGVVVRRSGLSKEAPLGGKGIAVQPHPVGMRGELALEGSVVDGCGDIGISILGSGAVLRRSVVRDSRPVASGVAVGGGVVVRAGEATPGDDGHGRLDLERSLVASNAGIGVAVLASEARLEGVLVRDTRPASGGRYGRGVVVQDEDPVLGIAARARADVVGSVVEGSREAGIVCVGSDLALEGTRISDTAPTEADGRLGVGVTVQRGEESGAHATARIAWSAVTRSHAMGILVFDAGAEIVRTRVEDTAASPSDGLFGDGVSVVALSPGAASASIEGSRISGSARAGIASFGAEVSLGASSLECNAIDLNGEPLYGPAIFADAGDNACGCPAEAGACRAVASALEPPEPLAP